MYLHPAAFPGVCDTQTLYLSMTILKKLPFSGLTSYLRRRVATLNPALGLTHQSYNRLQAGRYRTMDLFFKEQKSAHLNRPLTLVYLHRDRSKIANLLPYFSDNIGRV
jgi:hypothetical protein